MDATTAPTLRMPAADFVPLRLRLYPGGHAIDLTRPDMVLGRHTSADLRMPLPDVSRQHCRFVFSAGVWEVVDLESLNGVYVNGVKVRRADLHIGDELKICGLEFEVEECPADVGVLRSIAEQLPQRKAS